MFRLFSVIDRRVSKFRIVGIKKFVQWLSVVVVYAFSL